VISGLDPGEVVDLPLFLPRAGAGAERSGPQQTAAPGFPGPMVGPGHVARADEVRVRAWARQLPAGLHGAAAGERPVPAHAVHTGAVAPAAASAEPKRP
jgi:hypothetical protein